jgi:signal transduction histidine kinase
VAGNAAAAVFVSRFAGTCTGRLTATHREMWEKGLTEGLMRTQRKRHGRFRAARATPAASAMRREAALRARVAELEGEGRARDDFFVFAAHELRNPLTLISGRLELLLAKARQRAGAVPEGLVQGLERLERLVDAYLRRATNLLEVSCIEPGNLRLEAAEVGISALIRRVTANLLPEAETGGCPVRLSV